MSKIKDFSDLNVWNIGMDITVEIAGRLNYLSENSMKHLIEVLQQLGRMLTDLLKCITENISFSSVKVANRSPRVNQRPATSDSHNHTSNQQLSTYNNQQVSP
jgi:hypothetical protein